MNRTLIIAEAGVNHNGDISLAKKLVDAAAAAGVDFVKFQTFTADKLVSKTAKKAVYQQKNTAESGEDTQYAMLKQLELSDEDHIDLIEYCKHCGIQFFSTAFDVDGLDYLNSLGFELIKIPSGEITNYPYLKKVAHLGKPTILSTGMADLSEVQDALEVLTSESLTLDDITVLHCNTEYPTPMKDVNLKAMLTIQNEFGVNIGYSDHTLGIEVPTAAVALGAVVIEKHFTLDRTLPGPDHRASLEPNELIAMVKSIRNIEAAMSGNGKKEPSGSELKNKPVARKSIVAMKTIKKGEILTAENIGVKRPGKGMSPMKWNSVIGMKAKKDFLEDELIDI